MKSEQKIKTIRVSARGFAKKLAGVAPNLVLKAEPMPIQHVWKTK